MARRNVYGYDYSSNGWPMVDEGSCTWVTVPGTSVSLQIQNGQPLAILRAFAADFNAYVEPLRDPDSASWTPGNSVPTSNHLSGTAMDLNWNSHPFQIPNAGFSAAQIATVKEIQAFYEGTVFWGNDWSDPKDAMHFQLASLANGGDINTYQNPHTADFIARKIRADGFSTFRRGNKPIGGVPILAAATGLSEARAAEILLAVSDGLKASQCTNVNRIAMWLAQVGHESGSFVYTEEIASGAAYEGRSDLGNTQPGDGVRFKGRSWIQITGRNNYTAFSRWCSGKGLVLSPTEFVDNPKRLAELRWAGIGAAWYWTVARSDINTLSDRQDLETVTRRINGGTNGLADRRDRYNRALLQGDALLQLLATSEPLDPIEELLMSDLQVESLSIYATPGEPLIPIVRMVQAIDAAEHRKLVEDWARTGDADALSRIARTAAGQGKFRDAATIAHAKAVLADIEATNPAVLQEFISQKGQS
ncbi:M15 family metallopeptidase [Mycobacteroides abscessus subsp. abscessus]|uniref:M15 family metallopeptidase n=1 Tax=Mycobacteroides abscessus TaxID=36809 RepID=UPI00266C5940|nr:M15 family metallopeptidase [Mycobacteroides abscessus]MDO3146461.1 M15 family metallopeptidase [Mycobacteroides abscessus subsp. abscessus]